MLQVCLPANIRYHLADLESHAKTISNLQKVTNENTDTLVYQAVMLSELENGIGVIKNMVTGETSEVALDGDSVSKFLYDVELEKINGSFGTSGLEGLLGQMSF